MPSLRASRVTLVSSTGTPHRSGLPPPLSRIMDNLPDAVEVLRVFPFLPPGHLLPGPPLGLNGLHYDSAHLCLLLAFLPFTRSWALERFASLSVFFALRTI